MPRAVLRARGAAVQKAFTAGEVPDSGGSGLCAAGIAHLERLPPRTPAEQAGPGGGAAAVTKSGEPAFRARATARDVPNPQVFPAVVDEHRTP